MPQRPQEHKIGGLAAASVTKILKEEGFAVDAVSEDYGEDLLVQTDHEGKMDASRLWIQVKGTADIDRYRTSKKSKKERFSYPVSFDHVKRWIRTIDLVIVVLWDVEQDIGYYAVPRRQVDEWKPTMSGQKDVTLHFGKAPETEMGPAAKGIFSSETVSRLTWEARFEHFRMLTLSALDVAREREGLSTDESAENQKLTLITAEFLRLLGLTDPSVEPTEVMTRIEVRERATELYRALIQGELGECPDDIGTQLRLVGERVVLERIAEIDPKLGMPAMLLGHTAYALTGLLTHGRTYEELERKSSEASNR